MSIISKLLGLQDPDETDREMDAMTSQVYKLAGMSDEEAAKASKTGRELASQGGSMAGSINSLAAKAAPEVGAAVKIFSDKGIRSGTNSAETQRQLAERLSGVTVEPMITQGVTVEPKKRFLKLFK